jgi:hypothetical protein
MLSLRLWCGEELAGARDIVGIETSGPGLPHAPEQAARMTDFSHNRNLRAVALGVAQNRLLPTMRQLHENEAAL